MIFQHCQNCGVSRGFKRHLGWGTFFAVLLTWGVWLFVIPFYPKRCMTCGFREPAISFTRKSSVNQQLTWHKQWWGILIIIFGIMCALSVIVNLLSQTHL